jgi:hypothetical protein
LDRITKSLLNEFQQDQDLIHLDESDVFERLGIFSTISKEHGEGFEFEPLCVGGPQDLSLDGIGIIVNGTLITSVEEVDDLFDVNRYVEARFIFVQTKTASSFSGAEIGSFLHGVRQFFDEDLEVTVNDSVAQFREIQGKIYDYSAQFRRGKPLCVMYYVTTGSWNEDINLLNRIGVGKRDLEESNLFSDVVFHPIGADELHTLYQATKNSISVEFNFPQRIPLPEIEGVTEAYLGVLPATEYLTLVVDESGAILKSLFYDNVRDFQQYNPVNKGIGQTLRDESSRERFAVLNNGVTIVAKKLQTTSTKVFIEDYQIVNGCQTTHVLYDQRDSLADDVFIPIRVISTTDENLTNAIITATNRQTEVKEEDLQALSSFQRKLEAYFASFEDSNQKLYYERRSKQYVSVPGIKKNRIVTMGQQIRAFASMFQDQPHRASRHYTQILKQLGTRIFSDGHQLEPYYASAFALFRLESMFKSQIIPNTYRPARYVLMMALRYLLAGPDMPAFTANAMRAYTQNILNVLWDDQAAAAAVGRCISLVDDIVSTMPEQSLNRDMVRGQDFTNAVRDRALSAYASSAL